MLQRDPRPDEPDDKKGFSMTFSILLIVLIAGLVTWPLTGNWRYALVAAGVFLAGDVLHTAIRNQRRH